MIKKPLKSIVFIFSLTIILNSCTTNNELNSFSDTKLHRLVIKNDIASLQSNFSDVNKKNRLGLTPLHLAVFLNNYTVSEILISNKANINAQDVFGKTPLHLAAYNQNIPLTLLLLNNLANTQIKDNTNRTPIDIWPKITKLIKSKL